MFSFIEGVAKRSFSDGVMVNSIYHQNIFNKFRGFWDQYNLTHMKQLEGMPFEDLIFFKGFGKEKVELVVERYNEYMEYGAQQMNFGIEYTKDIIQEFFDSLALKSFSSGTRIGIIFSDNGFNLFRIFCDENRLEYIEQLEGFPFDKLTVLKGFGKSKTKSIIKRYEEFINGNFLLFSVVRQFVFTRHSIETANWRTTLESKRHFEKVKKLFGVDNAEEMKVLISNYQNAYRGYNNGFYSIPNLRKYIDYNEICKFS